MKSNNVIEINGNLYDAKSGLPLKNESAQSVKKPTAKMAPSVRSIDGFSRSTGIKKPIKVISDAPSEKTTPTTKEQKPKPNQASASRSSKPTMKRTVSRSTTLNRSAVKAPSTQAAPTVSSPEPSTQLSSTAIKHADDARFTRAKQVTKSSLIARFNRNSDVSNTTAETIPKTSPLTSQLTQTHSTSSKSKQSESSTQSQSTKERLIKNAIASVAVTDTTKSKKSRKHGHLGRYATSAFVAVVLAGYVAYLNVPSISMKVAAHRAGFAAAMPGYKPSGYNLKGPIAYSPGQVTVNFHSNTDNRAFSLKQQPTTWDSTALLENYVTKQSSSYLTYQDRGLTIYIYDGSSASWVNGGKLYNVEGKDSQLDTDQLLKLATSV